MILKYLLKWAPFKIDALGLVTLLGSEEVNHAVGTLTVNRVAEFLPLMGGHVIASDSIRQPISGFTLYNISDGICAPDVAGWFSRWLLTQGLTYNATTLTIDLVCHSSSARSRSFGAMGLGISICIVSVFLSIFMVDGWAFTNAVALTVSVLLRSAMLRALRRAVDSSATLASHQSHDLVKTMWRLSDGSSVIIYTSRGLITECLLTNPKPHHHEWYRVYRIASWASFIIHIISIGMAALPNQLLCVTVMALSTACITMGIAGDNQIIGSMIRVRRFDHKGPSQSMAAMFARLRLNHEEEKCLVSWRLMPSKRNRLWWRKYQDCLSKNAINAFDNWKEKETWTECESLLRNEEMQLHTEGLQDLRNT